MALIDPITSNDYDAFAVPSTPTAAPVARQRNILDPGFDRPTL